MSNETEIWYKMKSHEMTLEEKVTEQSRSWSSTVDLELEIVGIGHPAAVVDPMAGDRSVFRY